MAPVGYGSVFLNNWISGLASYDVGEENRSVREEIKYFSLILYEANSWGGRVENLAN